MAAAVAPSSFPIRLLKTLPLVALGLWTFLHINGAVADWMGPQMEACQAAGEKGGPGIPVIDAVVGFVRSFVCLMARFFGEGFRGPQGVLIWGTLLAVGYPWIALVAVESSRAGARGPLTWVPAFMAVATIIGISVVIPLLWLPAYFFSAISDRTPEASAKAAVSPPRVAAIGALSCLHLFPNFIPMLGMDLEPATFETVLLVMLLGPIVLPPLWLLVPAKTATPPREGHKAVVTLYHILAGACLAWHLVSLAIVWKHPDVGGALLALVRTHPGGTACQYFLLVDTLVMWLALLYHVLMEDGPSVLLAVLGGSALVGPGAALAFYYAHREEKLAQRVIVHNAVKKIK